MLYVLLMRRVEVVGQVVTLAVKSCAPGEAVSVVLATYKTGKVATHRAIDCITRQDGALERPALIRIRLG